MLQGLCEDLAARGLRARSVQYPLGDLPGAIEAVRTAAREERTSGLRLVAYGESAGASLVAVLAGHGEVDAAVAAAGPTDLSAWAPPEFWLQAGLSSSAAIEEAAPLSHATSEAAPTLVLHSDADPVVPFDHGTALACALPGARLLERGGGHVPGLWRDTVADWLDAQATRLATGARGLEDPLSYGHAVRRGPDGPARRSPARARSMHPTALPSPRTSAAWRRARTASWWCSTAPAHGFMCTTRMAPGCAASAAGATTPASCACRSPSPWTARAGSRSPTPGTVVSWCSMRTVPSRARSRPASTRHAGSRPMTSWDSGRQWAIELWHIDAAGTLVDDAAVAVGGEPVQRPRRARAGPGRRALGGGARRRPRAAHHGRRRRRPRRRRARLGAGPAARARRTRRGADGSLLVADLGNRRIVRFDAAGEPDGAFAFGRLGVPALGLGLGVDGAEPFSRRAGTPSCGSIRIGSPRRCERCASVAFPWPTAVGLDASGSAAPFGSIERYEWDLDGDGTFERDTGAESTTTIVIDKPGTIDVGVRTTSARGAQDEEHVAVTCSGALRPSQRLRRRHPRRRHHHRRHHHHRARAATPAGPALGADQRQRRLHPVARRHAERRLAAVCAHADGRPHARSPLGPAGRPGRADPLAVGSRRQPGRTTAGPCAVRVRHVDRGRRDPAGHARAGPAGGRAPAGAAPPGSDRTRRRAAPAADRRLRSPHPFGPGARARLRPRCAPGARPTPPRGASVPPDAWLPVGLAHGGACARGCARARPRARPGGNVSPWHRAARGPGVPGPLRYPRDRATAIALACAEGRSQSTAGARSGMIRAR